VDERGLGQEAVGSVTTSASCCVAAVEASASSAISPSVRLAAMQSSTQPAAMANHTPSRMRTQTPNTLGFDVPPHRSSGNANFVGSSENRPRAYMLLRASTYGTVLSRILMSDQSDQFAT
jgi:hypothetical protein